jgi:dihydrofolate synthase/folylpolyglutamate synthase
VNERIAVDGEPISDEAFTVLMSRLSDLEDVTKIVLTRFEILTAAAFLHFSDEGVDVAVVEVGLGGTWDSTNVIDGDVSVITNVSLDHTAVLGNTVGAIARDKVGILRAGGVAVSASEDTEVLAIVSQRASEIGSELMIRGAQWHLEHNELALGGRSITVSTSGAKYEDIFVSLHGIHQGVNAATAIVAAEAFLGTPIDDDVVRKALSAAAMPGRLEVVGRNPMIVVDGAHNPAGVHALCATLDGAFDVTGVRRCVVGMLQGRDAVDMVTPLLEVGFTEFHVTAPASPRAMPSSDVADAIRVRGGFVIEYDDVVSAVQGAREVATPEDLIVICGSLYVVAEARSYLLGVASRHLSDLS